MLISARTFPGSPMYKTFESSAAANNHTSSLQVFLQLGRIALHREIEIADGESADYVPNRAPSEGHIHARIAGEILNQADAALLIRRQPNFHGADLVGDALRLL